MEMGLDNSLPKCAVKSDVTADCDNDKHIEDTQNDEPRAGLATWRWIVTCAVLLLGALLYGVDGTIAADIQVQTYKSLGHIDKLPWIGIGFPMASAATILPLGRAYGLFNTKMLLLASLCFFEIGSAICGAAPTSDALIVGRVIAGMGGAGMYLGSLTYYTSFTTRKEAPLYTALSGLCWGVGCILGPVIGGAFSVSRATWRWAFYINLPLAAFLVPVCIFFMPSKNPRPDLKFMQKLKEIDWIGAALYAATVVLFMIVLTFSGSTFAWKSGGSIALWVAFGVCLIAFVLQQGCKIFTSEEHRIFPVHFLKSRTLVLLYIGTGAASASEATMLFYIPLFFQFTKGDTPLQAGVRLLPFIGVFIFFLILAGASLPKIRRYNMYYLTGGCLVVIGGALLCTINENTFTAAIYGYEAIVASGVGLFFQIGYGIAVANVHHKDAPKAVCFINVAQIGVVAISLALSGSLFQNVGVHELEKAFAGRGLPEQVIRSALAGKLSPLFSSNDQEAIQLAVKAIAATVRKIFSMVATAGALGVVSSLLMRFEKLNLSTPADRR